MKAAASRSSMRIGIIQFPGSNCDQDCFEAFKRQFAIDLVPIWHKDTTLPPVTGLIVPGGFSYGDYLRSGALAAMSPIMQAVVKFANSGGAIIGICNGFQILTEAKLLPGTLLRNAVGTFICQTVELIPQAGSAAYHAADSHVQKLRIPIAHGDGRYHIDSDGLKRLQDRGGIAYRYAENPNGSVESIAGVLSENGRVLGLMPHPERATDALVGPSTHGLNILSSFIQLCE